MTPIQNPNDLKSYVANYNNGAIYYIWAATREEAVGKAESWKKVGFNLQKIT